LRGIASQEAGTTWKDSKLKWVHTTHMWKSITEIIGRGIKNVTATIKGVVSSSNTIRGIKN